MYSKFFTRLFLLIGMIGLFSVPMRAEEVTIGSGTDQQPWLPCHSNYRCSYTQQIYTADEIDHSGGGIINSIAFYNKGTAKTRTWDIYLVNTDKSSFTGANNDWIDVSQGTLVFSGSISLTANQWTTITFTTAFDYTGSNLAVVVNDKTGSFSSGQSCLVFTPTGNQGTQAHYISRDGDPYDPSNPNNGYSYQQASVTYKNQIILDIEASTVTCAKPKSFAATGITAHTATLTWQPGAEGQSNWDVYVTTSATDIPDDNATPTYQVTECSKALANLTAQTTYYAYVRAACSADDKSKWANKTFTTTREALTVDANNPYAQNFETSNDWGFTNGTQTNQWYWGNAINNGGDKAMYISNNNGTSYAYTVNSTTVVFASKLLNFAQGTYTFVFDWQVQGEGSSYKQYDYLRAVLAPGDVEFTAGSLPSGVGYKTLPDTWIALDGGQQLNLQDGWQSQTAEAAVSGTYTMVFIWCNDSGGGTQPPAAIDNISISFMTCPRPTNLTATNIAGRTATLTWTENGTASNWVLQYATNSAFTENLTQVSVSGTATKDLTDLTPETTYYARVKSVLGNDESSWSDIKNFTTTVTCPRPTNLNASNITTTSVQLSWTAGGSECGWDISICETTSMHPETDGEIHHVSENPYTVENLTPDKMYYSYVRANCGGDDGVSAWSVTKGFTTLPTCIKPTNFTASNVTSLSAVLSWTAGEAGQDAWNIMYKKDSDTEWTTIPVTATTYTLTNLSPVSTYYAKVQADCGEGDLSKWAETTFTTGCGAIDLPYTCDFEGTSQTVNSCKIPSCWSVIRGYYNSTYQYGIPTMATPSTSTQPIVQQTHSGSYSLYFLNSTNYGTTEEYAILPEISENYKMKAILIRFWVRSYSSACTMEVGIMTDPSTASTYEKVADVGMTSTYTEKTISLNSYSGNGRYIALKCPAPNMYSQAFYVDDITVEYIPSCLVPNNLSADEVGVNEATLTWTPRGEETAWNVQYKKVSDSEWSAPIAVDEATYKLTGLQRSTEYEVRVQANCDDDDQSDWTNPISFETECGTLLIDFTKKISGYGNSNGGYYLIASPIGNVNPAEIDGMIANPSENYDFYKFDQTQNLEWMNYKAGNFNMVSGKGYLYANKNGVTLSFTGTPNEGPTYEMSLVKDDDADFAGWNLVGNPFAEHTAYIDRDCFVINTNGRAEIIASDTRSIEAMEGAFVIATENDETLVFSTEAPAKGSMVTLNLSNGHSVIDRAIVRFGEGRQLPKFQLRDHSTKIYIPIDGQDYAVIHSESMGELPVSFKAEENGTYTIGIHAENVEFSYLHLIDNLTSDDINLLATPSYSFEAKTTDPTTRFKLVFVCENVKTQKTIIK